MAKIKQKTRKKRRFFPVFLSFWAFFSLLFLWFLADRATRIAHIRADIAITAPEGIESLEYVDIGGIRQAILIRGQNVANPLLLVLHGGPGYPEIGSQRGSFLEEHYTVVYYDQRLAGKTRYANNIAAVAQTDSVDLRIQDVLDLSAYLAQRFDRPKIALYGVSWGSVLGVHAIQQRPDLFSVYVSVSQLANQRTALSMAYDEGLRLARENDDQKNSKALEALAPYPGPFDDAFYYRWWRVQQITAPYYDRPLTLQNGGLLEPWWRQCYSPYYSLREALYFPLNDLAMLTGRGLNPVAAAYMFDEFDLQGLGTDYNVPIIWSNGERDWIAPPCLVEEVFEQVTAPYKAYYVYEGAGHGYRYDDFYDIMTGQALTFAQEGNA